jgi:glutamate 5-kinase
LAVGDFSDVLDAAEVGQRATNQVVPRVVVVKLGTTLVARPDGRADPAVLADVARQVAALMGEGRRVAVVSSGAVGLGLSPLHYAQKPRDLPGLQAAAAAGQPLLMAAWAAAFGPWGRAVGQVLVTREDADDRGRYLNVRNTIDALWRAGAVPIVNENDTVSTSELGALTPAGADSFGDNDRLAAALTSALSAELLVLLSNVGGLLDADGRIVARVPDVDEAETLCRPDVSRGGTGGMRSKLDAARAVTAAGEPMVLADGRAKDVLLRAVAGEAVGTRFEPAVAERLSGRLRWIASSTPAGRFVLDAGAVTAVRGGEASLLPAGVTQVDGMFVRGDVVSLCDTKLREVARGITNHDAGVCSAIAGKRSSEAATVVGPRQPELVHRDHLVLLGA